MISDGDFNRDSLKRVVLACLTTNPEVSDCTISFDKLSMLVIDEFRALIRHRINAMSLELI